MHAGMQCTGAKTMTISSHDLPQCPTISAHRELQDYPLNG